MGATATADTWVTYWDELPEGQLLFRPEADEYVRNLLAAFALTPRTRLLDFGCGYGFVTEALAPRVAECLIWDAAPSMCRHTLARLAHHTTIRWIDLNDHQPEGLDLILVNSVLQYMTPDELSGWLGRWRSMLAATGQIVLSDLLPPGHGFVKDLFSLLRFSVRRGYLFRAIRNVLATRKRYQQAEHARPLYHPAREELTRMAQSARLQTRFLERNLTHFRGRVTAVLTPGEGGPR
jgi:trans-aconitate methyltransferase